MRTGLGGVARHLGAPLSCAQRAALGKVTLRSKTIGPLLPDAVADSAEFTTTPSQSVKPPLPYELRSHRPVDSESNRQACSQSVGLEVQILSRAPCRRDPQATDGARWHRHAAQAPS